MIIFHIHLSSFCSLCHFLHFSFCHFVILSFYLSVISCPFLRNGYFVCDWEFPDHILRFFRHWMHHWLRLRLSHQIHQSSRIPTSGDLSSSVNVLQVRDEEEEHSLEPCLVSLADCSVMPIERRGVARAVAGRCRELPVRADS